MRMNEGILEPPIDEPFPYREDYDDSDRAYEEKRDRMMEMNDE